MSEQIKYNILSYIRSARNSMPYYPSQPDHQPADRPPQKRIILRRMILCVSVLLIVYGAVRLIGYAADLISSRQTTQELREIAAEAEITKIPAVSAVPETATPAQTAMPSAAPPSVLPEEPPALSDKLPAAEYPNGYELVSRIQKLRKKSKYIIGWITMDNLDEPVALEDNSFFLDHDAAGKRNSNGAIFMDEETSLLTRPYTILLYGHNMKSGAMFGSLRKYEEFSYYYRHRMFRFDTLYEEGQYVIFAVETISLTPGKSKYVNLSELQSMDRKTRQKALQVMRDYSLHSVMLDVNEEDQIVLLITCVGDDDERLIVAARRLRDGETAERLDMPYE